jgi:hypothetical protein
MGGVTSNMAVKLPVHADTGRACARPAPARPAAYGRRWAAGRNRQLGVTSGASNRRLMR